MCAPLLAAIPFLGAGAGTAAAGGAAVAAGAATTAATTAAVTTGITATQVMTALSIASAGASMFAQHSAAKAQAKAIGQQQDAERSEANEKAEEEIGENLKVQRQARARALVAAGESGAQGASFMASINQSLQDQDEAIALAAKGVAFSNRATDDRANVARSQIRDVSAVEAGLNIAGAGISGYNSGLSIQAKRDGR